MGVIVDMHAQTDVSVIGHCIKNTSLFLFLNLLIDLSFYLLVYYQHLRCLPLSL